MADLEKVFLCEHNANTSKDESTVKVADAKCKRNEI